MLQVNPETPAPTLLEPAEGSLDRGSPNLYCEHCPMWGQCSVCGSDHPGYFLLSEYRQESLAKERLQP